MRERPIIMQGESVRAILAGRKTQTRRVVKPQPPADSIFDPAVTEGPPSAVFCRWNGGEATALTACPYGAPGDKLFVKEAWEIEPGYRPILDIVHYRADGDPLPDPGEEGIRLAWRSPLFMPRWASRLTLEVVEVRVQRVQEISEQDAEAEGIERDEYGRAVNPVVAGLKTRVSHTAVQAYRHAWDALNAKRGFPWSSNPWVWAVTFKRVEAA